MIRQFDDLPERMKHLPISDKGFPIPYFAAEVNGKRDFRVVCSTRMGHAVRNRICWVCGGRLGVYMAFVIGPMCGINRTISDPPSHRECAIFSAKNCPFLSNPAASRNERDLPENGRSAAGCGLKRNPGATGVWITKSYKPFKAPGGILFEIGDPEEVIWFCQGRVATRKEVEYSIETGLPHLREDCDIDGPAAHAELDRRIENFQPLLPA